MSKYLFSIILVSFISTSCKTRIKKVDKAVSDLANIFVPPHKAKIPEEYFDPSLKPYIAMFVADARKRDVLITDESVKMLRVLKYVDNLSVVEDESVIAACSRFNSWDETATDRKKVRWNIIEVRREASDNFTGGEEMRLRELIYHELFHCFLNKGHLPDDKDGLMSPNLSSNSDRVYGKSWEQLIDEAFSKEFINLIPDAKD